MSRRNRTQQALDCAIANVTGDDLRVIRQRGFSLIDLQDRDFDPEADLRAPFVLDWDRLDDLDSERRFHQPSTTSRQVA